MAKRILTAVLAAVVVLSGVVAVPAARGESGAMRQALARKKCVWCGRSYSQACKVCAKLEAMGYDAWIEKDGGMYEVWCQV